MPFESHKLMKTVPVIRCAFCSFERAGGESAEAEVKAHEETRHAKELFEQRFEALKAKPAPPRSGEPARAVTAAAPADVPDGPSGFEVPAAAAVSGSTPAAKGDQGDKKSTKPGGAGTAKTAT